MALISTLEPQSQSQPVSSNTVDTTAAASILSMLLLSAYAAKKSKKAMRKLKRRLLWTAFKAKLKSMFSRKKQATSDRTLLYILLGVLVLALLLIDVVVGRIVLLAVLILYLLGVF